MSTKLVNVRLDEEHSRKARTLRENGLTLSDIVRQAIDGQFEKLRARDKRRDTSAIVAAIHAEYPDLLETPPRAYDVHDARQARAAIRQRLHVKKP